MLTSSGERKEWRREADDPTTDSFMPYVVADILADFADVERERDEALAALDAARSLDEPDPCDGCADRWRSPGPESCADRCSRLRAYRSSPTYKVLELRAEAYVAADDAIRERDEARAAVTWAVEHGSFTCSNCPEWRAGGSCEMNRFDESPEDEAARCRATRVALAYKQTGGTVPDAPETTQKEGSNHEDH
jgi:hypothetical protein